MSVLFVQEWPHASYPPWAHGPGYIISRDIAKFIVRSHHERDLKVKNCLPINSPIPSLVASLLESAIIL